MPLKAYVGLPRAGKSYEVVVNVILPALAQGRRVVSNIAGLNYEAFCSILYSQGHAENTIGKLVLVSHTDVEQPTFWRTDFDADAGTESFIQPGDLVALDEIWRFWKKRGDIHPRAMNFCRMHGHMTDSKTGLTCEIALITQSIRDINENIRDVVQETFHTVKNTKLGSSKSYIVHVFQRGSVSKSDFIRTLPPRFYKPEFFPLYKSHSQHKEGDAAAIEKNPDDRANILKGGLFKIGIPLALLLCVPSFYFAYRFFHPAPVSAKESLLTQNSPIPAAQNLSFSHVENTSTEWLAFGYLHKAGIYTFFIRNAAGKARQLVNPPSYNFSGSTFTVELPEGGFATSWASFNQPDKQVIQ